MKTLLRTTFGSHLYGTSTPASDRDYKGVHIPSAREMLLHRTRETISHRTKEDRTAKNTAEDIDFESFALHKLMAMLAKGDANALEILFAPREAWLEWTGEWATIHANRDRLLSLTFAQGFVGYMTQQAAKYGVKGSRMGTVRAALAMLDGWDASFSSGTKLSRFQEEVEEFNRTHEHAALLSIKHPNGPDQLHWEVVSRKFPLGLHIGEVRRVLQQVFDNYGQRTRAAEANQGVDWKAMSHAIRVGNQAIELLTEGTLTLPRPDAAHLLAIKQGQFDYKPVEAELEGLIETVKDLAAKSTLLPEFDWEFANRVILYFYGEQVMTTDLSQAA